MCACTWLLSYLLLGPRLRGRYYDSQRNGRFAVTTPVGTRNFFLVSTPVQTRSGAHPYSCWMGAGGRFSKVKAAGAWCWPHTPPSSAQVKNVWSRTSSCIVCFHGFDTHNFIFVVSFYSPASEFYMPTFRRNLLPPFSSWICLRRMVRKLVERNVLFIQEGLL